MFFEVQHVVVNFKMTVRAEQNAFVDLTFDAFPRPSSCLPEPKIFLARIKMMELKGCHAPFVAADTTFTTLVFDGSYLFPASMLRN
jgi:hypothetical protein